MTSDPIALMPIYAGFEMLLWLMIVAVAAAWWGIGEYLKSRPR